MNIETPEGFSLFGEPLYNPVSYPDPEHKQLVKFRKAYEEWENDPEDRQKILLYISSPLSALFPL